MKQVILMLGVIAVLLVAGCTGQGSTGGGQLASGCPNLTGIENYGFHNEGWGGFGIVDTANNSFDGWQLRETYTYMGEIFTPCSPGSQEGENVNYYYCRDMTAKKIDSSGNIVDTKTVTVVLSLYYDNTLGKTTNKTYINTIC